MKAPKMIGLLLQLLFFSLVAQAQFNQSQSQLMQSMTSDGTWFFDGSGHNHKGEPYLSYKNRENWIKAFYFKNDRCVLILLMIPNAQLSDVIRDMNSKYTSEGNNLWTDNKEEVRYAITLRDEKPFFEVTSMPLSLLLD